MPQDLEMDRDRERERERVEERIDSAWVEDVDTLKVEREGARRRRVEHDNQRMEEGEIEERLRV